jgi:hypothetical protein
MMRYRLRTLMIVLAVGPPVLAALLYAAAAAINAFDPANSTPATVIQP